jgi:hypothetical protein
MPFQFILRSLDTHRASFVSMNAQSPWKRKASEAPSASIDDSTVLMLEDEIRTAAAACAAVASGNFSKTLAGLIYGATMDKLQAALNGMVDKLVMVNRELAHLSLDVNMQGISSGRLASVPDAEGVWLELTHRVGAAPPPLICNPHASQINQANAAQTDMPRLTATIAQAVASGDLTRRTDVEVQGAELATLKVITSAMVHVFAELTRVTHVVSTQGVVGGRARIERFLSAHWACGRIFSSA